MRDPLKEAQRETAAAWEAGTTAHMWLDKACDIVASQQDQKKFSRLFSLKERSVQLAHLWAGLKRDIERERGL